MMLEAILRADTHTSNSFIPALALFPLPSHIDTGTRIAIYRHAT